MTLDEFGPFMVEQRKKNNLTQAQVAEQLKVSIATISKWERCCACQKSQGLTILQRYLT